MTSCNTPTEIQSLQSQIDELKKIIQEGLKTPRTKVDPEQLKFAAASIPVNISLSNTPSSDELKKLKENYEILQKQVQKLEYQLVHVLRACTEKDSALSKSNNSYLG